MDKEIKSPHAHRFPKPTKEGLINFLASGFTDGVGKVFAGRFVDTFGEENAIKFIESPSSIDVETLTEVPGLGHAKAEQFIESIQNIKYPLDLLVFLYSCGLGDVEVDKIVKSYGDLSEKIILYDPYEMIEDAWKLTFITADKIGKALGIGYDDPRRIRGAILTALRLNAEMGHLYATEEQIVNFVIRITGVEKKKILPEISALEKDDRIIFSEGVYYLPVYYKAEKEGAERIGEIIRKSEPLELDESEGFIDRNGNTLSQEQVLAVRTVMENGVTIITGGPGTGKTTAIRGIIEQLEKADKKVILVAPTGRAAKRMSDLTGCEAQTIHRLLGYRQGRGYSNKHLDADVLIIDEGSMLEQVLFNHLLQAVKPKTRIVIVGDVDQLPPIGAGDVLREMINSRTIPVIRLNENFRQRKGSLIAANAEAIREGFVPDEGIHNDFEIILENSAAKIKKRLLDMIATDIPERYGIMPSDIQVVSPQQDGPLGTKALNIEIQEKVNPSGPTIKKGSKIFRLGDRVMQTSNSSSRNTYNGETGRITEVDVEENSVEVTFNDGKVSKYFKNDLGELSLAYAITVHKMQGSETDYMVMPLSSGHRQLLYRNLLYTAVSRAKKLCVIIAEEKALNNAVHNEMPTKRNTCFHTRLRENILSPNHRS